MAYSMTRSTKRTATTMLAFGLLFSTIQPSNAETFAQRHPRRAEVLRRDARLNRAINNNYGHLDGRFGQLKREDTAIARQEQADARFNGGYITKPEQRQLNKEENRLHRQFERDLNR